MCIIHYILRWPGCYHVNVRMCFNHLTDLDFILIIWVLVSLSVLLQVQIAEAKITHVIQLKHTLDLVPQLKVCVLSCQIFKSVSLLKSLNVISFHPS